MPGHRHRNLVRSRRRVEDEGEEEGEGSAAGVAEDTQSEPSVPSDNDDGGDADDSDLSESDMPDPAAAKPTPAVNGKKPSTQAGNGIEQPKSAPSQARNDAAFTTLKDTEAMMNGLTITGGAAEAEPMDFEALGEAEPDSAAAGTGQEQRPDTLAEKRRREHEEYRKKRDSDPAFIPSRGAFFMHDQRSAGAGHSGVRPAGRGRGRGRGVGGPFSPANLMAQAAQPTNDPWQHDLHESLNEASKPAQQQPLQVAPPAKAVAPPMTTTQPPARKDAPPTRSFSSTKQIGTVQLRVLLPNMKAPIGFVEIPVKQHTRLPNHRPPLRRDKPVRVSIPNAAVHYIFPSAERSFIFIPRAQRPNQQFVRGRGRPFGSVGGFSSRRTSAYGGSIYSPSIGMSRRSSLAGGYPARDGLISPTGSVYSRIQGAFDTGRPVVRLPPGSQQHTAHATPIHSATMSGAGTPVIGMPPPQSYPLPQKPAFRENWSGPIPMHQPRPQKNVSVSGIESPESLTLHAPQQQQEQPFHQQVPAHVNRPGSQEGYQHSRQPSFAGQPTVGTPLGSNIPERAIHAQPFQPYQQPPLQPPAYPAQPAYYYPPAPQGGGQPQYPGAVPVAPMFMTGPNGTYLVPTVAPTAPAAPPPPPGAANGMAQPNMVPYEMNGTVYYYDQSQHQQHQQPHQFPHQPVDGYAAAAPGYTMPGMGGMMTPTPDGAYYYPQMPQGTVYYPAQ